MQLLLEPSSNAKRVAEALLLSTSPDKVLQTLVNASSRAGEPAAIFFPIYHRAFPTHSREEPLFWHLYGTLLPIGLIIFTSLPAALTTGCYLRER